MVTLDSYPVTFPIPTVTFPWKMVGEPVFVYTLGFPTLIFKFDHLTALVAFDSEFSTVGSCLC